MDQYGEDNQPTAAKPSPEYEMKEIEPMAKQTASETGTGEEITSALPATAIYENASKWLSLGRANVEALMHSGQATMKGMMAVNEAVWKFSDTRLQKNLELSKAMFESRDIAENLKLQAEHGQDALEEYFQLANEMINIGRRAAQESWDVLENRANANLVELEQAA